MKKIIIYTVIFLSAFTSFSQNIPRPNISGPFGVEVNAYTGNLFYQRNDINLRGVGLPIYGSFFYNSVDTLNYGFGFGWTFYYSSFYQDFGNWVIIQHSDAKKDSFALVNGVYKSPEGVYDVLVKVGSEFILTAKDGYKQYYSNPSHKRITKRTDANGNAITIEYSGNVISKIRNSSGKTLVLSWSNGLLASVADSALPTKKFNYEYDSNKDLISVTNPMSNKTTFRYFNHRITWMNDENNNPVAFTYTSDYKVNSIQSCNSTLAIAYIDKKLGKLPQTFVSQSSAAGDEYNGYLFDEKGRLKAIVNPDNKTMVFTYEANNNLVSVKDWNELTTSYTYDAKGNVLSETDPQGNKVTYTYETVFNKPLSVKDKRGQTTTFQYDANGNLKQVNKPGSIVEKYNYYPNGNLQTFTNANLKQTNYVYNSNGDLVSITYPVGGQQFEYSGSCCNLSKVTDANGNSLNMTYDLMNRVTSITDDLGNQLFYKYDAAGNLIEETDANQHKKQYAYDALNRLISVSLPNAGTWVYQYDGIGNLTKLTDANGKSTAFVYDKKNLLLKETDPIGNSTSYSYDANGNLLTKQFPNGNSINYKYDKLNRLIQKDYPGNSDKFSYDANGNLASAFNNNIAYTFEYDNLNRLKKKNILNWNKSLSYNYDDAGNRTSMIDHDGATFTYSYDDNNRLVSLINAFNLTTSFQYDLGGRLIRQNNDNNTYAAYSYDAAGRIDSIKNMRNNGTEVSHFYYSFDNLGNRKTMIDKRGLHNYGYDSSYRLTNVQYANGTTENFTVDPVGNRKARNKNGAVTNYTYNSADQIVSAGSTNFTFDGNGNTTQQTDTVQKRYEYDGENRLVKAILNNGKTVQYYYDPFGDKIQRIDSNGTVTKMIYDGENLLAELDNNNITITKYTTALGIDSWIGMNTGGVNYFYHKDGLNSTTELTNSDGLLANEYNYDVYGNVLSQSVNVRNIVLYTGRLWDGAMRLYDYRSRFYNSLIGSFVNKDKFPGILDAPLSINKFLYVNSNPINFNDPKGNFIPLIYVAIQGYIYTKIGISVTSAIINIGSQIAVQYAKKGSKPGCLNLQTAFDNVSYSRAAISGGVAFLTGFPSVPAVGISYFEDYLNLNLPEFKTLHKKEDIIEGAKGYSEKVALSNTSEKKQNYTDLNHCEDNDENYTFPKGWNKGNQNNTLNNDNDNQYITITIEVLVGNDPNEIIGPQGYGDKKWVSIKSQLPYKILFENTPLLANAPAQRATIYLPLPSTVNASSLRLGDFGFGNFNFSVPPNLAAYSKRLDLRDSLNLYVDVIGGLDIPNRRAFWTFQSIDPATGLAASLPPLAGFLPVNDSITHKGEGYVTFSIAPSDSSHTLDSIPLQASIIFDSEVPVLTNTWVNTIDAMAPTSNVDILPLVSFPEFPITWSAKDDTLGSGLKSYDIYYSKNNGPYNLLSQAATGNGLQFVGGDIGTTYSFYSIASDNTGNKEANKTIGDAITSVKPPVDSICPGQSITIPFINLGNGYTYQWQVNQGNGFVNITNSSLYTNSDTRILTINNAPSSMTGYLFRCVATYGAASQTGGARILRFVNKWTGSINSAWETPGNWSCNSVPDQYTDVIINSGVPNNPVLSSNSFCNSLKLGNGSKFMVNAGFGLTVISKQ